MMPDKSRTQHWMLRVWGVLDAFYILYYLIGSLRLGRVPFITDAKIMVGLLAEQGVVASLIAVMSLVLQVSIVFSAFLLLLGLRFGASLGIAQIPFRLLSITPSLSVLSIWASLMPGYNIWLMLGLIVISEVIKGGTLWWAMRPQGAHRRA
ncbi:hypothetical protein BTA49_01445 [Pseudomonas mosselii]|nr:hypothetical protein BTA49_01445 [Pseudomonas mosselii]